MSDIIEKVKEKAKDVKDKVVDNTKDIMNATKESFSASPSSSIIPNPNFTSSSVTYVSNPEKNNSDTEGKKIDSALLEHSESEQKIFSTNIKEKDSIKNTNYDSEIIKNQQIDNPHQHQYDYKENNELFNPFIFGIQLWQNYYTLWINFYTEILESFNRTIRNI
jgi:hypothetical protein